MAEREKDKTMLWITHLHEDHLNQIFQINRDNYGEENEREEETKVGFVIVGVGGGEKGLPKDIEAAREQAQKAEKQVAQRARKQAQKARELAQKVRELAQKARKRRQAQEEGKKRPNLLNEILNWHIWNNIQKVRVWGAGSKTSAESGISKVVGNFWRNFPHENIKLEPLIPTGEYAQGQKNLKTNDTSLALALEY